MVPFILELVAVISFIEQRKPFFFIWLSNITYIELACTKKLSILFVFSQTLEYANGVIVILLLIINAILGIVNEYRAHKALQTLKSKLRITARVLRDKKWQQMDAKELVTGDVVRIRSGDFVPAVSPFKAKVFLVLCSLQKNFYKKKRTFELFMATVQLMNQR